VARITVAVDIIIENTIVIIIVPITVIIVITSMVINIMPQPQPRDLPTPTTQHPLQVSISCMPCQSACRTDI
jgi:hypothetical protein